MQLLLKLTPNAVLSIDEIEHGILICLMKVVWSDGEDDNNVVQNSVPISYTDALNAANMLIKCSEKTQI